CASGWAGKPRLAPCRGALRAASPGPDAPGRPGRCAFGRSDQRRGPGPRFRAPAVRHPGLQRLGRPVAPDPRRGRRMSSNWKSIALTVVLAALASTGGAWLSAGWMMKRHETPSLHEIVHRKLALSPQQKATLDAIEAGFDVRREALEGDVRAANRDLAQAIAAS